jgi:hypothetical protein
MDGATLEEIVFPIPEFVQTGDYGTDNVRIK